MAYDIELAFDEWLVVDTDNGDVLFASLDYDEALDKLNELTGE